MIKVRSKCRYCHNKNASLNSNVKLCSAFGIATIYLLCSGFSLLSSLWPCSGLFVRSVLKPSFTSVWHPFPQNPKFQEPVTLDFLDAELENDIKVEVECVDTPTHMHICATNTHTHKGMGEQRHPDRNLCAKCPISPHKAIMISLHMWFTWSP